MIQICRKDKEKVYKAIRSGKIDAAGKNWISSHVSTYWTAQKFLLTWTMRIMKILLW